MNQLKLLLDEDVYLQLSIALRRRNYDVIHVQECNRKGFSDIEQLNYAIEEERCIITFNIKDYILLHNKYNNENIEHFGIIVTPKRDIRELISRLSDLLNNKNQIEVKNNLIYL
jgi:predicted nuclease of predicted toxin-antitoxin system